MATETIVLTFALAALMAVSIAASRRVATVDGFFRGLGADGSAPGLVTLVLSQVTTWIFARSLLTAAILAFHYGIAGALAYTAYYLSFFTGGLAIDRLRRKHGVSSIQSFLHGQFGAAGTACFNAVVAARLLSEVFANLLVVGLVFGAAGSGAYTGSIVVITLATLAYSMMGGLSASLKTDVIQMSLLLALLVAVWIAVLGLPGVFILDAFTTPSGDTGPGWVLLAVALLQVWSYPLHDPVMTDRGFLAGETVTRRSFWLAGLLSMACIFAFALLGNLAANHAADGQDFQSALQGLLGAPLMVLVNLALVVSAISTLDSTLSSAAKLVVVDMGASRATLANGRIAMALCMLGGLAFLFFGSKDLYTAVAVSGTASMFLAPVLAFSILGGIRVPAVSYMAAFVFSMGGAALYFLESTATTDIIGPLAGVSHSYSKLLIICIAVLAGGFGAFALGALARGRSKQTA